MVFGGPTDIAELGFEEGSFRYEVGVDYEHAVSATFGLKVIGLHSRDREKPQNIFDFLPAAGLPERSLFEADNLSGEDIARLELSWLGWKKHQIQFGGEFVRTFIDSTAAFLFDDGTGAGFSPIQIDGANTRVQELRGEVFINASSTFAKKWKLDSGFAVELSDISQTGDTANSRFFVYPKPFATLTYAPNKNTQIRLSAARGVGQLSFSDFVSAVNFDDEDIDFGNPDLQPQRSWETALSVEKRFGRIGVITLEGFYNAITDVEDLLPITDIVEVPGNIGPGKIYGVSLDTTLPLDWLGLKNARLDANATVRKSSVIDPLTGKSRSFSFTWDNEYAIEFRHDLPTLKSSWGWDINRQSEELAFGLDEVSSFRSTVFVGAFFETTAVKGLKIRVEAIDLTNATNSNQRTIFQGARNDTPVSFQESRRRNLGGEFRLVLSGNF